MKWIKIAIIMFISTTIVGFICLTSGCDASSQNAISDTFITTSFTQT